MINFCKKLILLFALAAFVLLACTKKPNTTPTVSPAQTVKDTDGNVYHTVTIGTQTWLVENLKTTHYRDGTPIPSITGNQAWGSDTLGAYCNYNNSPSNADIYGRLYNWFATTNGHNISIRGWHVPSDAEWTTLTTYLGDTAVAGGKLKETGTAHWISPNTGATNESGFSALPGGLRNFNASFFDFGFYGYWWSSTQSNTIKYRYMSYNFSPVIRNNGNRSSGFSVRCVRD